MQSFVAVMHMPCWGTASRLTQQSSAAQASTERGLVWPESDSAHSCSFGAVPATVAGRRKPSDVDLACSGLRGFGDCSSQHDGALLCPRRPPACCPLTGQTQQFCKCLD